MASNRSQTSLKQLLKPLTNGKYSHWAEDLDHDTLEALLWALGEFAYRAGNAVAEDDMLAVQFGDEVLTNLFCVSWTLELKDVLEFSTDIREKLHVEKKAFDA